MFDPTRSELERDTLKLGHYVDIVQQAFGSQTEIVAVLEVGSFSKGEAVSSSDIDTRVYIRCPDSYIVNLPADRAVDHFCRHAPPLPMRGLTWASFNEPVAQQVSTALECQITFGFVDARYAAFILERLDQYPSDEHALLFQSNPIYDPWGFIHDQRCQLAGVIVPELVTYYLGRVRWRLEQRLPAFLAPNPADEAKLRESGQIPWVAHAVRCVRDAIAAVSYRATGHFVYTKPHVLAFVAERCPEHTDFVSELYRWKTDEDIRKRMVEAFRRDREALYQRFQAAMPRLSTTVEAIMTL